MRARLIASFSLSLLSVSLAGLAQVPPPPRLEPIPEPPPLPAGSVDEPRVRIPVQQGDKVEEIRDGGEASVARALVVEGAVAQ